MTKYHTQKCTCLQLHRVRACRC